MTVHVLRWRKRSERGVSLLLIALGLTVLLGIAGIAVDLASLYVARNEEQRAADAAALAGATRFETTAGLTDPSSVQSDAARFATQVGNQNLVMGHSPDLEPTADHWNAIYAPGACLPPAGVSGGCFNFSVLNNPRISVTIYKRMPTYFVRIFGIRSVPVSATATAEVYIPAGNGPASEVSCAKPWLLANCDPDHGDPPSVDPNNINSAKTADGTPYCPCTGAPCWDPMYGGPQYMYYFVNPTTNQIVKPGLSPTGAIGEPLKIKTGDPTQNTIPSQFMPVYFPGGTDSPPPSYSCPTCASNDQNNSTSNSASLYRENIECCSSVTITCGSNPVEPIQGNMVGPTGQGVDCLIHQGNNGSGQDCISLDATNTCGTPVSLSLPFIMYAGTGNKSPHVTAGAQIPTSDSLVTMPLYDGEALCPGNSCPQSISVGVQGFLSVFITHEGGPSHSVWGYVTGVTPCGGAAAADANVAIPAVSGNPIPIRLIH